MNRHEKLSSVSSGSSVMLLCDAPRRIFHKIDQQIYILFYFICQTRRIFISHLNKLSSEPSNAGAPGSQSCFSLLFSVFICLYQCFVRIKYALRSVLLWRPNQPLKSRASLFLDIFMETFFCLAYSLCGPCRKFSWPKECVTATRQSVLSWDFFCPLIWALWNAMFSQFGIEHISKFHSKEYPIIHLLTHRDEILSATKNEHKKVIRWKSLLFLDEFILIQ